MADSMTGAGGFTRGSRDLDFMTTNPAMEAYQAGQVAAQKAAAADASLTSQNLANDFNQANNPTRLRQQSAEADTATANSLVATGTVQPRIDTATSGALTAGANADVAVGTVGSKISDAAAGSRLHNTQADVAAQTAPYTVENAANTARTGTANADVAVATVPDRIQTSRANANNASLQAFDKVMGFLKNNDFENAKLYADRAGETIPPEILQNAEARQHFIKSWEYAKQSYPDRPNMQHQFMQGYLKDVADKKAQGLPTSDPALMLNTPGAPEPPEMGAGRMGVTERIASQILQENKTNGDGKMSYAEAVGIAKRAPNGDALTLRGEALALNAAKSENPDMSTLETWRQKYGLPPAPQAAPPPAQKPGFLGNLFGSTPPAAPAFNGARPAPTAAPALPQGVPQGSLYSPSRNMWKDPQGNIYGPDGTPARL